MLLAQIINPRLHKETGGIAFLTLLDYVKSEVCPSSGRHPCRNVNTIARVSFKVGGCCYGSTGPYTRTRFPIFLDFFRFR